MEMQGKQVQGDVNLQSHVMAIKNWSRLGEEQVR